MALYWRLQQSGVDLSDDEDDEDEDENESENVRANHPDEIDMEVEMSHLAEVRSFRRPLTPISRVQFREVSKPRSSKAIGHENTHHSTKEAMYAHAKLYALADYMLLPDLQALAFERLRTALTLIDTTKRWTKHPYLIQLVENVYGNTMRSR